MQIIIYDLDVIRPLTATILILYVANSPRSSSFVLLRVSPCFDPCFDDDIKKGLMTVMERKMGIFLYDFDADGAFTLC